MKTLIYVIVVSSFIVSCNPPTLKENERYFLYLTDTGDIALSKSLLYRHFNTAGIKLIICTDHSFHFEPETQKLKEYEGFWKYNVSIDDYSIVFNCKNGVTYNSLAWYKVKIVDTTLNFYFILDTFSPR